MSFLGKTIGKIVGHSASTPNKSTDSFSSTSSTSPSNETSNKQSAQQTKFPSPLQQPSSQLSSIFQRNHQVTFSNQYQQDAELTLTHLKKVFYELLHAKTSQEITQNEKDEKIYSLLPLFIKVFFILLFCVLVKFYFYFEFIFQRRLVMPHLSTYKSVSVMWAIFVLYALVYLLMK
jgi:hypothetical protein